MNKFEVLKIKNKLFCITILIIVGFSCSEEDSIDCIPSSFPDSYNYPIKPGTQEWNNLYTREARVKANEIPQYVLETISTGGLLESLLSYPYILDYLAWEEFQTGFEKLKSEQKGFAEVYKRDDLFQIIVEWYESISLDCKEWIYHPINAPVEVEINIIEMIIFQDDFLNRINQNQMREIFELIYKKLKSKGEHGYSETEKTVSVAILGKIMYREEFKPFTEECINEKFINFFIQRIPIYRPDKVHLVEIITKYAEEFYLFPYRY